MYAARDIISSRLITHPPSNLSDLIDCYNSTLTNLIDKHAPLVSKIIRSKPPQPWFTPALNKLKSAKRRLERAWSKSHSSDDLKLLRSAANHYHAAVIKAQKNFNISLISSQVTSARIMGGPGGPGPLNRNGGPLNSSIFEGL